MFCIHHDDLDGYAAARVVAKFEKDYNKEHFFEANYKRELPFDKIKKNEKVYVVDYSFSDSQIDLLQKLMQITNNIIWIDHHKSSIEMLKNHPEFNNINGIVKDGISGAALAYMYLYNVKYDDIPLYLKYVSDYDLWLYRYGKNTEYFSCYMNSVKFSIDSYIWEELESNNSFLNEIIEDGKVIRRYIETQYQSIRDGYGYECDVEGYKAFVVNSHGNSWVFGNKINEYDLCVLWKFDGERYCYSLYSHKDVDCSEIAVRYGGGGHKAAAGCTSINKLW